MTIKGFAAAHRHKGGFEKWVYDMIVSLSSGVADAEESAAIKEITDAIGDEDTANTILYRIKALETAAAAGSGSGGSGSGSG